MNSAYLGGRGKVGEIILGQLPGPEDTALALSPVVQYTFDDGGTYSTVIDSASGHRDLTITGSPTFLAAGPSGNAMAFPSGAYASGGTTPLNQASGTLSLWFKAALPSSNALLFGLFNSSSVFDKVLSVATTGIVSWLINDGTARTITIPAANISYGRWNHIVATFGSGTALYLNGGLISTGTSGSTLTSYTNPNIYIGGGSPSSTYNDIAATFDEINVFPTVLNAGQVNALYVAGIQFIATTKARLTKESVVVAATGYTPDARVTKETVVVAASGFTSNARVTKISVLVAVPNTGSTTTTETISDTLTFTATLARPIIYGRALTDTLTFTQTIVQDHYGFDAISETLVFSDTAIINRILPRAISDTLSFTETSHISYAKSVSDTLSFTDTIVYNVSRGVEDTLTFTDSVDKAFIRNRSVLHALNFTETTQPEFTLNSNVSHTLTFTETVGHVLAHIRAALHTLTFHETVKQPAHELTTTLTFVETAHGVAPPKVYATASSTLSLTDTTTVKRIYSRAIVSPLAFTETAGRQVVRSLNVTDDLTFAEGFYSKPLPLITANGQIVITLPVVSIIKVQPFVIMRSPNSAIVLPTPEFNDTDNGNTTVLVQRSMIGDYRTYVRPSQRITLSYTYILGRRKALELKAFVSANLTQLITLINWKGESYVGFLGNNPVSFNITGRYVGESEKVSVAIEFQGYLVST